MLEIIHNFGKSLWKTGTSETTVANVTPTDVSDYTDIHTAGRIMHKPSKPLPFRVLQQAFWPPSQLQSAGSHGPFVHPSAEPGRSSSSGNYHGR